MTNPVPPVTPWPGQPEGTSITREELQRMQQAIEDLARAQQDAERSARTRQGRAFAAGFAGSALGRLAAKAGEKFLEMSNWFGFFG